MHANSAFVLRNIHGKNILMPIRANNASSDPILLNDVAASIWLASTDATTAEDVLQNMIDTYGLEPKSPEAISVENFINNLLAMGLLVETTEV